jgi:hypothetical protein
MSPHQFLNFLTKSGPHQFLIFFDQPNLDIILFTMKFKKMDIEIGFKPRSWV